MTVYDSTPPVDVPERLLPVIDGLTDRFAGVHAPQTVSRMVVDSYQRLLAAARVEQYLPVLAKNLAADRLCAAATASGILSKDRPEVLFVCVHNAGRSQMAAGLLEHRSGGRVLVRSAGSAPTSDVNPAAVDVMSELGIDLSQSFPKPLTNEVVESSDVVITMGCGDACPVYPGKRYLDWDLDDPAGQPIEVVRRIRDDIDERVQVLVAQLLPVA